VEIRRTAVVDPATTVPVDVRAIIDGPTVSGRTRVSGYRYDVKAGCVEQIVAFCSRDGG
jgi:hypothetical protein